MIIGIQLVALLFAFSMIYFAVLSYKKKDLNRAEFFSWLVIWAVAIVIVIFPELLRGFAKAFFVTRVFDLMTIGGFIVVISMASTAYIKTKRNEKKLEDLVRREALKNAKTKR